jgi:hypothetical protein
MKKERLCMPRVNGDQVQLRFAVEKAVFKHQVTATQTEIIGNLTLNAGSFYVRVASGIQHHFGHNRFENLLKAGKVSEIRTSFARSYAKARQSKQNGSK